METPARKPITAVLQLQPAEYVRQSYVITAAKGLRPADVINQDYYANVAAQLKPWDRIELRAEDGTWCMDVVVLEASRVWARVFPVSGPHALTTADISQTQAAQSNEQAPRAPAPKAADFTVLHRGPRKWSVIRAADRAVMHEGEQTRGGAQEWLSDYLQRHHAAVAA